MFLRCSRDCEQALSAPEVVDRVFPSLSMRCLHLTVCGRLISIICVGVLTEEDVLEPPRLLRKALSKAGLAEQGIFDVCDIGESREFE